MPLEELLGKRFTSGWSFIRVHHAEEGLLRYRLYDHEVNIDFMRGKVAMGVTIVVSKRQLKAFVHIMNKSLSEILEKVESQAT